MKDILIRIGHVFVGVFLLFGIMLFLCAFDSKKEDIVIITEEPTEEEDALTKSVKIAEEFGMDVAIMEKLQLPEIAIVEEMTAETVSVSANVITEPKLDWISDYPKVNSDKTLEQKMQERSSFAETVSMNAIDQEVIANNTIDFSDIKITIMGDSITTGVQLKDDELYLTYPNVLKEILGCKEIVNLGIGGSAVSRAGNYAMVERWSDIPKDSDIIIIFGASNDCLFETHEQFGSIAYDNRKVQGTFCGDLDEMLSAIEQEYQTENEEGWAKLIYINPPSTTLNSVEYQNDSENIVHQSAFAEAINTIAPEYGFEVIDLYNNNILNCHDAEVNAQLVPDGIHPNAEGHRILAEHIASQIIQRIEQ